MTETKTSEKFIKGTFILTIASFVVKVIGSLNWIFVSRILGGEGIGLYQMAFPIYFFAMTVSQAGVPVAISIITAERVALNDILGAQRVFRISMFLMLLTGIFFRKLVNRLAIHTRSTRAFIDSGTVADNFFRDIFIGVERIFAGLATHDSDGSQPDNRTNFPRDSDDCPCRFILANGFGVCSGGRKFGSFGGSRDGFNRPRLLPHKIKSRHRKNLRSKFKTFSTNRT